LSRTVRVVIHEDRQTFDAGERRELAYALLVAERPGRSEIELPAGERRFSDDHFGGQLPVASMMREGAARFRAEAVDQLMIPPPVPPGSTSEKNRSTGTTGYTGVAADKPESKFGDLLA
jgi:hypothetical protein